MILILTRDGDLSCDLVIDWLKFHKHDYIRINSFDLFNGQVKLSLNNEFEFNKKILPIDDINSIWYRKFGFFEESNFYENLLSNYNFEIVNHITKEYNRILSFFMLSLKDKKWLTSPFRSNLNKLHVLNIAKCCGLNVPLTHILNFVEDIPRDYDVIVKSVLDPIFPTLGNNSYAMYTTQVLEMDKSNLPSRFFPSLVQQKIEKKYEVRLFYLNGICYSMAIFSQNDTQTKLDFRMYNWDKPNRCIPYKLPKEETFKIRKLMTKLKLNCASIDMIKTMDGQYCFLEINPVGQFGMVDFPCNYGLHRKVAETLIKMDKK